MFAESGAAARASVHRGSRPRARAQEASQIRLRQQDNSATWDYVGDSDPDPSAHGGTASEGSGRGGDGNGATDGGNGAVDDGDGINGDGSEGAQSGHCRTSILR